MKKIPTYSGTLRSHLLAVPHCISECSGIRIFGRRIKSLVFTTDVAIIKNVNGDAIIAVYPFTPQPSIAQAIISVARRPGVRGRGRRDDQRLPLRPAGGVRRAPGGLRRCGQRPHHRRDHHPDQACGGHPVIATIISSEMDVAGRVRAGADILNISGAARTPEIVAKIRKDFPDIPIIATGGPTEEDILRTIQAGANAITYTPPSTGELFSVRMHQYRAQFHPE